MAILTRLASTLTAKYFPSQTLTDSFYIDGRLFGKRETRQADITIDKEERGFFLSVFAHPRIPEYEPGMMPPYEPELRHTCNEVKFGRKEIDGMIQGLLTTAVDVTGKMKLGENNRSPYFSGVIVRDSEAFAVTIGSGLAFLYRDDTLFPLTDAGIPMEPIDANGNRVADFLYYCSSKTANALWSNFFTLCPDDCIILCNKEIYDALGQREILRILNEAEDQCDAAGVIITQASARMPNVPMQFSISFVESVTSDEKRGLFGFRKKNKEPDTSEMTVKSTFEGGVVGAAATAAADAGFAGGLMMTDIPDSDNLLVFGDNAKGPAAPATNQVASKDKGIEVAPAENASAVEFLDTSISKEPIVEVSAEDMMRNLFGNLGEAAPAAAATATATTAATAATAAGVEAAATATATAAETTTAETIKAVTDTPFVASFNPFDEVTEAPVEMKVVSDTPVEIPEEDENAKTKPVERIDTDFLSTIASEPIKKDGIIEAALREMGATIPETKPVVEETPVVEEAPSEEPIDLDKLFSVEQAIVPETKVEVPTVSDSGELVFSEAAVTTDFGGVETPSSEEAFNPYSVGDGDEMKNAAPLVFGDDGMSAAPDFSDIKANGADIPDFKIVADEPVLTEDEKLPVDFPVNAEPVKPAETVSEPVIEELPIEELPITEVPTIENVAKEEDSFSLPFANVVETIPEVKPVEPVAEDIPDMPLYETNTFDSPVVAVNSEQPTNSNPDDVYTYGQYQENANMSDSYTPFGSESNSYEEFNSTNNDGYQYYQNYNQDVQPDNVNYGNTAAPEYTSEYSELGQPDAEYTDFANAPTYDAPAEDGGDDWINGILGLDGMAAGAAYQPVETPEASYTDFSGQPQEPVASPYSTPVQTRRPKPQTSGSGNGRGGNGHGKRRVKLNRNGYIFLAFVVVLIVAFIILVSIIARSCSKKDKVEETTEATTTPVSIEQTEPVETTPAPVVPENDPLTPMGKFYFSDNIGYKCWWDLFNKVYSIQITGETDQYVQTLIDYNNYYAGSVVIPAGYTPVAGDQILLPSIDVISGNVVIPEIGGTPSTTDGTVSGEFNVVDGDSEPEGTTEAVDDGANPDEEPAA